MGWHTVHGQAIAHRIAATAKMRPWVRRYVIYASRACWGGAWSLELCTSDWPAAECTLTSAAAALPCQQRMALYEALAAGLEAWAIQNAQTPGERRGLDQCSERCPAH